uniref:molybdopterin-synthase adenylyltransferase MoeB n=1 Tax=Pararhizobium sp. IMCC3301 TaxID=3067904 RepID=UPI002740E524|nr:molybdopterin-synthase adenylyltransferase MoeB [Pararhizobium sp. IMCC3301]
MTSAPLSPAELERYARHLVLPDIGGPGQQKLKAARVLVVGAGGLGAPVLMYLAAAGIGHLGLVDDDHVSLSNLQRQIIHTTANVGIAKVESAAALLTAINPHPVLECHNTRLDQSNAAELIADCDVVVDGSDNFATRFLVADTCEQLQKTLVTGAVNRFDGSITTLQPFLAGKDGTPNPRYRDLFPEPPDERTVLTCEEAGIMGALTGVIGSLQALEVIKAITGTGQLLVGRHLLFDASSMLFYPVKYARSD